MTNEPQDTTLADYARVLRQRKTFIAVIAVLCAAVALGVSAMQTPKYEATSSVAVRDVNADLTVLGGGSFTAQTPLQLSSAHQPQVTRPEVVQAVYRALDARFTPAQLKDAVAIEIDPNSLLVTITAHARHARDAAAIANAFARQDARLSTLESRASFKTAAAKLNKRLKSLKSAKDDTTKAFYISQLSRLQSLSAVARPIAVSDVAQIPGSPASPKPVRNTVVALIFGLLLGVAIAYARAAFDHRLRQPSDVTEHLPFPVVGRIRSDALGSVGVAVAGERVKGRKRRGPLTEIDQESFRILRHNVRYLSVDDDLGVVLVTSAMAQEGKSTVSSCLAMAHAAAGRRTLLIECDLRRPVLAERFGLPSGPGLTDYLTGHAKPQEIIRAVPAAPGGDESEQQEMLICIPAGSPPPRPADLLGSERFRNFVKEVSEVYETVIIDSAPLLTVADTLEIVPAAQAILLCVRLQQSTRDQALAALDALQRLPERPTGLVLTDVRETGDDYYSYYAADTAKVRG